MGFLQPEKKVGVHSELSSFSTQFNVNDELKWKEHMQGLKLQAPPSPQPH